MRKPLFAFWALHLADRRRRRLALHGAAPAPTFAISSGTFTESGTLVVTGSGTVNYEIVAAGGSGGRGRGGGGGAGRIKRGTFAVEAGDYPITVGAASLGVAIDGLGNTGADSAAFGVTAKGGGAGGGATGIETRTGGDGGHGGGAGGNTSGTAGPGGASTDGGNAGGAAFSSATGSLRAGGGGGGEGSVGGDAGSGVAGTAGTGSASTCPGVSETYSVGGAGAVDEAAGTAGATPGSGGSGTHTGTSGDGAAGIVHVWIDGGEGDDPFDLLSDTEVHATPDVPMPGYMETITDSVFGTSVTRITGTPAAEIPGVSGKFWGQTSSHQYSKLQAWNSDQTMIMLEKLQDGGGSGGELFIDGETYAPLFWRNRSGYECRWSRSNPALMLVINDNVLSWWDVAADTYETIQTFTGHTGLRIGSGEGEFDRDGDIVVLSDHTNHLAFAYRISDDTKGPVIDYAADSLTLSNASISPLGGKIVAVVKNTAQSDREELRVHDAFAGTLVLATDTDKQPTHFGLAVDQNGDEVAVGRSAGVGGALIKRRITDGAITTLASDVYPSHASAAFQGDWVGVDFKDVVGYEPYLNEIVVAMLDGSAIYRVAHHHAYTTDYDSEVHSSLSPDGKRAIFVSNWGLLTSDDTGPNACFIVDFRNWTP